MPALQHCGAAAPGLATPERATFTPTHKDETPRLAGAGGFRDGATADNTNFQGCAFAGQALAAIHGETQAAQYLARLHAQQADPDELALIVAALYGAALQGFCRAIAKALGVRHG
jgi:hypothetical protein